MPGKFIKMGSKLGTTYEESSSQMANLLNDYYAQSFKMAKSAGAGTYGIDGYFNAIMGKEITAGMFASDNLLTAIGSKPYAHEGVRVATELAQFTNAGYQFPGESTAQDGKVPASVSMPVQEIREPYKDLPFSFDYGLGLQALENKDDTVAYKDYVDMMGKQYTDGLDKSICRPLKSEMKKVARDDGTQVETTLEYIARINGSFATKTLTEHVNYACPYGGETGDFAVNNYRTAKATNLDGQFVNGNGTTLTVDMVRRLYRDCSVHWNDSANPNNKIWAMSHLAQEKLAAITAAQNIFLDSVYVQKDFNGVKTMPGRDAGMLLSAYQNVPIIQDGNLAYNYTERRVSTSEAVGGVGDVHLLDLDHLWLGVLTPVELFTITNPAITRTLRESNVMTMRAEVRSDRWLGSGILSNFSTSA